MMHNVLQLYLVADFKTKTLNLDKMKIELENLNEPPNPQLNIGTVSGSLLNSTLLEANKAIDECVMKTGLKREQVILYISGKVDRYKLLMTWCNDC